TARCGHGAGCNCNGQNYCGEYSNGETTTHWPYNNCNNAPWTIKCSVKTEGSRTITTTTNCSGSSGGGMSVIGTTDHTGFFSLGEFNGKLYAGTYSLRGDSKLYSYPPWEHAASVNTGESIYDIEEYKGSIYLNSENRGRIFKSSDGRNFREVFRDTQSSYVLGFGLTEFQGNLYASTQTMPEYGGELKIWKTSDGENWNQVSLPIDTTRFWTHDFIEYNNRLYAFIVDQDNANDVGCFVTSDGNSWSWIDLERGAGNVAFAKGVVWNNNIWIIGKGDSAGDNFYKVLRFNGTSIVEMYRYNGRPYATDIVVFNEILYLSDSVSWNATTGNASLYKSLDGASWSKVYDFPEHEITGMHVYNSALYIRTKHKGGTGKVYKYTGE
ncbi:hypothetical protein KKC83_05545, partial [Patescibacteria group bacterium]|nr:hypothetical protein [Patescibacteria group bacterium]MBU4073709.1 hypothetical protein [Patescibacteria group bacterium]MBU4102947.1 hypothetical protein [Patescibacteria group bacterium]MBU4124731.1 hypothetical protein [Patescibacteria group bacterium]